MAIIQGDRLILVRHAMPEIDSAVPAEQWHLGVDGLVAARALRQFVSLPVHYVASTEQKALQTLQEVAGRPTVTGDACFAEVRRPHVWSDGDDYRAMARAYVQGQGQDGWEEHAAVVERFDTAVVRHAAAAAAANTTLVIGTHGMAMTIWLASRYDLGPDPVQFWEALRFPDLIEIDLGSGAVTRPLP